MKRLLLFFFIALASAQQLFAQIGEYRNEFAIGGGAGVVLSNVGFMPEVPQKWHEGRIGGLSFRYTSEKYFNSVCAVVAELNYAQVGWKEKILTRDDVPVINTVTGQAEKFQRRALTVGERRRKGSEVFVFVCVIRVLILGEEEIEERVAPLAGVFDFF
jgi:hypothetical protein